MGKYICVGHLDSSLIFISLLLLNWDMVIWIICCFTSNPHMDLCASIYSLLLSSVLLENQKNHLWVLALWPSQRYCNSRSKNLSSWTFPLHSNSAFYLSYLFSRALRNINFLTILGVKKKNLLLSNILFLSIQLKAFNFRKQMSIIDSLFYSSII
jgi:hypothetical protein